ncbi:lipoyl synthase [Thermoclostridium stercorarium]|uniref:lipoyl synthase n=1 Tax=Thermoclostridium stercorarium TaxID=1510 RepID=UPI0022498B51|nr:lipoyl synthase [Thermoclostridium stercorarium]UZQ86235.1 lipoyl synthase [Thermoclostridium stercorarium]
MERARKPEWLRVKAHSAKGLEFVEEMLKNLHLNTVCDEAACPNRGECFGRKTATFMILGNVCTRNCTFCNVSKGKVQPVDENEPERVAKAVKALGLKHAVITSVTRDDLPDGGAGHFARVIEAVRNTAPGVTVEVLIPDFKGNVEALKKVVNAHPEIINHNVETVPELYSEVRPMADYRRSLEVLKNVKELDKSIYTKSGIMVGLGETEEQVISVMQDLRKVGCDFLTIGQYLAPSVMHHPVVEYVHPDRFKAYEEKAYQMGFLYVASGPLVRSSYMADQAIDKISLS